MSDALNTMPTIHEPVPVSIEELTRLSQGKHHSPHSILGAHLGKDKASVTVRSLRPFADSVSIVTEDDEFLTTHESQGVWVTVIPTPKGIIPKYQIRTRYRNGENTIHDPYAFLPTLGELDLHLIKEGRHEELWTVLGANVKTIEGIAGTSFSVWAPNAQGVRIVGSFNHWSGINHPMRSLGVSGVWELFIPGIGAGNSYKFEILTPEGNWIQKADPMAKAAEVPPATASIVAESEYRWQDASWLQDRAENDPHKQAISIYEVHLGSWRQGLSYLDLADQLVSYVKDLGFTHVEFLPLAAHPYSPSWGYQVTGYYAPTPRFGSPDELRYLIDKLHQAGIGVIMDWVPAHFPKDAWALGRFDGTALYEHPDPLLGDHPDWGTYIFNFGRNEVRNFLVANAIYWLEEFHVDALRVDAVASMLYLDYSRKEGQWRPNAFGGRENLDAIALIQEVNATAYKRNPGIMMIAEESTSWPGVTTPTENGGLGFGFKWNMGWMNDTLRYLAQEPINRQYHHHEITFSMVYAYSENFILPISHDEVVHGKGSLLNKMPGDDWKRFAGVRNLFAYQWAHPGKKLTFMGNEFAQGIEWKEASSLDWYVLDYEPHRGIQRLVRDLNAVYRHYRGMWALDSDPNGFEWIESHDYQNNVISFIRTDQNGSTVVVVVNFAGTAHFDYRIGLPNSGMWREIINTDSVGYGGSGVGNLGAVYTEDTPWAGRPYSARVQIPALGVLYFTQESAEH